MHLESYRQYLSNEFERRKARNASYSLRAFARDLNVSASRISEAMSGKRGISIRLAEQLIEKIGLEEDAAEIFKLSVVAEHSRSKIQKARAKKELSEILTDVNTQIIQTQTIVDWVTDAVLKLNERESVADNVGKISDALEVPQFMIINSLRFLTRLGLIRGSQKFKTYLESRGAGRRLNVDYLQIIERAQKAYGQNKTDDNFNQQTFLIQKTDLKKVNQILLKSLNEIRKLEIKNKNAKLVYVAMQVFSVEK